jgi:hypothetical protein
MRPLPKCPTEKGSTVKTKALGPIAVAVVLALSLLGPSAAMGESTALCKVDEDPCNSPVSHVHYFADDIIVLTNMDYECDALLLASVGGLGSPQILEGEFTYTSCDHSCTREEENGPAVLKFLKTGHESAEGTGESLVHVECSGFIDCNYTLENVTGTIKGPLLSSYLNGEIRFEHVLLTHESGGFLCPEAAYLDAAFVPLSKTYISS